MLLLQVAQLSQQIISHCFGILVQFLPSDSVQHLEADPALDVSSSEGIEKDVFNLVGNFLASDDSADGEAISNALGHGDDVRLDSLPPVTPEFSSHSAETCLNLVADNQTAVLVSNQIHHLGQVALRQGVDSSHALNALEDESRDLSSGVGVEGLLGIGHQLLSSPLTAPVGARPRQFFKLKSTLHGRVPSPHVGDVASVAHQPVVPVPQRQKLVLVGEQPGEEDCEIIGLSARVAQVDTVVPLAQLLTEPLGVLRLPLGKIDRRGVRQLGHLLGDHLGDGGVRMPQGHSGDAGDEVDVPFPLVVEEILQVALSDQQRLLVIVEVEIGHEGRPVPGDLLIGETGVGERAVTALRHLQRCEARKR